jgi:DNA mismatch repair protein MutS2
MAIRKSSLRHRAEEGPGSMAGADKDRSHDRTVLGRFAAALGFGRSKRAEGELWAIPLPDLLAPAAAAGPDPEVLVNLLDLAFLGRASAGEIDREIDGMPCHESPWRPASFVGDLFVSDLVRGVLRPEVSNRDAVPHGEFLLRVLGSPPVDLETIRFRQGVLRELGDREQIASAVTGLHDSISRLLTLLRASRDDARLEPLRFRFDVLRAFRDAVGRMADDFSDSRSGLQRLAEVGEQIRQTPAFERMAALLDHHDAMASLDLEAIVGADGRLRHLEIRGLRERRKNPFFRRPLRRWFDRLRSFYRRYDLGAGEVSERLVMGVYHQVAPAMARAIQLLGHLEVYMASRAFARRSAAAGLQVCLPEMHAEARFQVQGLFNPLLLTLVEQPIPTDLEMDSNSPVMLITGPNSGGKTRLLQAIGICQILAQSGLYAPCTAARLPIAAELFASIIEVDRADQAEGRLGTELMRLRLLFETVPPGSLVLLDELCSGTNPSEAIEIVDMVLRLLHLLQPVAFVTTHFLDFADQLQRTTDLDDLGFLQAEVHPQLGPTFRFVRGVATTSLAVGTARRLGITFEEFENTLQRRLNGESARCSEEIDNLAGGDQGKQ